MQGKKKKKKNEIFSCFYLVLESSGCCCCCCCCKSMAGMLPGVECARRRRFHQSVAGGPESANLAANGGTRRSCLSLYPTNNETHHTTFSLMVHTYIHTYIHTLLKSQSLFSLLLSIPHINMFIFVFNVLIFLFKFDPKAGTPSV